MDANALLNNLRAIVDAPGGISQMRDLVLELAVRGLLVSQIPDEGTGEGVVEEGTAAIDHAASNGWTRRRSVPEPKRDEIPFPIPKTWTWARLPAVSYGLGQTAPDRPFTYLDVSAVDGEDGSLRRRPAVIAPDDAPSRARKLVRQDTVLYSTIRPYLRNVVVIEQEFDPPAIASTAFAVLHPIPGLRSHYLKICLRSAYFSRFVESRQKGVAYPAINDGDLAFGLVPVPPLAEQSRIVSKVDELMGLCDELDGRREQRHGATNRLRASALDALANAETSDERVRAWDRINHRWSDLFDSQMSVETLRQAVLDLATNGRLGVGSAEQWKRCPLGTQITLQRGFDITKNQQRPGPIPVVSSGGALSSHSEAACRGPGVVIGRKGSVGRVHWVAEDYWPHDTTLWVKDFHDNDPEYVYWFLRSFPLLDYESSTANPSLNRNRLHPVVVTWPDGELQAELVRRIRQIFKMCDEAEASFQRRDALATAFAASLIRSLPMAPTLT